jgi:serine/threonine protein kinase
MGRVGRQADSDELPGAGDDDLCLDTDGPEESGESQPTSPVEHEADNTPVQAEKLFETLAAEPYETVFIGEALDSKEKDIGIPCEHDPNLLIRNLDTNEYRQVSDSVVADIISCLQDPAAKKLVASPWAGWWAEKRNRDANLWCAAESGSVDMIRMALVPADDLSAPSVSVNSKSIHGRTALHMAASVGKPDVVEILLDAGADLEARTEAGLTALHVAGQRGNLSVATLLLDRGAKADPQTKDRMLPLHFAAMNGHVDVVTLLLERGEPSQLTTRNSMGRRASEVCLDIRTAAAFQNYEASFVEDINGAITPTSDKYAGRTAYHSGDVLLHNARADMVLRLLSKTQKGYKPPMETVGDRTDRLPYQTRESVNRIRAPFARVSPEIFTQKVGPDSFVFIERIGGGSFGEVFQVKHKHTERHYAMKILKKSKVMTANMLRYTLTERNVLSQQGVINHPYMVSLHYAFQTHNYLALLLQFCPGGNLQKLIEKEKQLKCPLAQMYTAEILLALCHLHERQIIFRDLKPDNIVIDDIGHAMLTDFGLSKEGVSTLHGTKSFCGSLAFIAPEILSRKGHKHTVDIYGLGVLLFDMLTGMPPFYHSERDTLLHNIKYGRINVPDSVPKLASCLIHALMQREPTARLGANGTHQVKCHEYFADIDFDMLMRREMPPPVSINVAAPKRSPKNLPSHGNPFHDRAVGRAQNVSGWSFAAPVELGELAL